MKTIIIAAIAPGGVIGRTSKPCETCSGGAAYPEWRAEHGDCPVVDCNGTGRVPANDMPWSYPEDMKHFRDATMGHVVIAGRRTAESIGKRWPLKGRTNVEVSRSPTVESFDWPEALHVAMRDARDDSRDVYVIGGAQLYAAAIPFADELDLTLIGLEYEGDVLFPEGERFHYVGSNPGKPFHGVAKSDGASGVAWDFDLVECRPGEHPDLTFTRWVRR